MRLSLTIQVDIGPSAVPTLDPGPRAGGEPPLSAFLIQLTAPYLLAPTGRPDRRLRDQAALSYRAMWREDDATLERFV